MTGIVYTIAALARLEDLIASVEDAQLRQVLADEVKALKSQTTFGLVYERHLPETLCLAANGGLRLNDDVRLRKDPADEDVRRVVKITGRRATLVDSDGVESTVPIADLMVVKRFGDPIFPTISSLGRVDRHKSRPYHTVINSENYHALQLLAETCEGQVDCIYIDPPYNSGARDWKYNNAYVDSTDTWRHSKWLSFMEKRLRIAKRLLKPDGVLIVTIDENEVHHLGVLLEKQDLFREYLRYMVTIVINPKGTNKANFGRVEEYALFIVPNTGQDVIAHLAPPDDDADAGLTSDIEDEDGASDSWIRPLSSSSTVRLPDAILRELDLDDGTEVEISLRDGVAEIRGVEREDANAETNEPTEHDAFSVLHLRRRGAESSFRNDRWRQFYAIKVDTEQNKVVGIGPAIAKDGKYKRLQRTGNVLWLYPIDEEKNERVWRYGRDTMQKLIDAGEIRVGKHAPKKPQPYTLNHWKPREGPRIQRVRTVWWRTAHDAGTHGTTLLSRLLGEGKPFSFPKSVYAVRDCLDAVVRDRKDALIVDFFAGSGTTLHATCLLNAADGGRRRTIMVTNNEVEDKLAARLRKEGFFPGDKEFDAHGIFESVTRPRCEAVLTGKRPDGKAMPAGKKYQHLDGRPFANGFDENCEFFRLDYLDPDNIELGRSFDALHPHLWLAAGARAKRPAKLTDKRGFAVVEDCGYAVLFNEAAMPEMVTALRSRSGVTHIFLRATSEDAYAEMCELLGAGLTTQRLYSDYLDAFRRRVSAT